MHFPNKDLESVYYNPFLIEERIATQPVYVICKGLTKLQTDNSNWDLWVCKSLGLIPNLDRFSRYRWGTASSLYSVLKESKKRNKIGIAQDD